MPTYHHGNLREALLTRAVEVIGESGVEGLSLRRVAKDIGVSHAAPTRHFASKADLLAAIVSDGYAGLTAAILAAAQSGDTPRTRLNLMARATMTWAIANRARFTVMTNPDVSRFADDELKAALADFSATIAAALSEAQGDGFMPGTAPATLLVYAVGAALGASTLLTDGLMRTVLPVDDESRIIADLAELIVPD